MSLFRVLKTVGKGAARLAKENPEVAAVVIPGVAALAVKKAPKLVPVVVKVARVVKAVR